MITKDSLPLSCGAALLRAIKARIRAINAVSTVYFAKDADLVTLNKAVLYVRDNEQSSRVCIVHFVDDRAAVADLEARVASGDPLLLDLLDEGSAAGAKESGDARVIVAPTIRTPRGGVRRPDIALQVCNSER